MHFAASYPRELCGVMVFEFFSGRIGMGGLAGEMDRVGRSEKGGKKEVRVTGFRAALVM